MLSRSAIRTAARSVVAANAARSINRVVSIFSLGSLKQEKKCLKKVN